MTLYRSSLVASLFLLSAVSPGCGGKDTTTDTAADTGTTTTDGGALDGGTSDGAGSDGAGSDGATTATDADGDGFTEEEGDCDDNNAAISPGLAETCNGIDDNCDGNIDEGFTDTDADGTADCVDVEECDGVDNNGDGNIDEGFDVDGDGVTSCADTPDCDDNDAGRSPLLAEVPGDEIDNDCDLLVDEGDWAYGDLVISELMINPLAVSDGDGEWFEVVNQSGRSVFLNGLTITSDTGETHTVDTSELLTLEPDAMAVFGLNGDTSANGGVSITVDYDDIYLLNTVDSLAISAGDVMLDDVSWGTGTTMISGASWSLDDIYLSADGNDGTAGWCLSRSQWADGSDLGTPGAENDLCSIIDHDGDGFLIDDGDCDDRRADVYP
ncbi:MAG: hypothetical protein GXP62_00585, partial [Oligoflexia bacterium]|nr:hypothetical protein [Oligoflexia bacterium]